MSTTTGSGTKQYQHQHVLALSTCDRCCNTIMRGLVVSPLYHCVSCSRVRHTLFTHIETTGCCRTALSNTLRTLIVQDWSTWQHDSAADSASVCAIHLLVMCTERRMKETLQRSVLQFVWDMIDHAERSQYQPVIKLLSTAAASWVRALPLTYATVSSVTKLYRMDHLLSIIDNLMSSMPNLAIIMLALTATFPERYITSSSLTPPPYKRARIDANSVHSVHSLNSVHSVNSVNSVGVTVTQPPRLRLTLLSTDVLGVIFSYLAPARILWGCALTNQDMSSICHSQLLWKHIYKVYYSKTWCHERCSTLQHDWIKMYMRRRATLKRFRAGEKVAGAPHGSRRKLSNVGPNDEWLIGTYWRSRKVIRSNSKGKGRKTKRARVVMCRCCGCNYVALTRSSMLFHCAASPYHIVGREQWGHEMEKEFVELVNQIKTYVEKYYLENDRLPGSDKCGRLGQEGRALLRSVISTEKWSKDREEEYRVVLNDLKQCDWALSTEIRSRAMMDRGWNVSKKWRKYFHAV